MGETGEDVKGGFIGMCMMIYSLSNRNPVESLNMDNLNTHNCTTWDASSWQEMQLSMACIAGLSAATLTLIAHISLLVCWYLLELSSHMDK